MTFLLPLGLLALLTLPLILLLHLLRERRRRVAVPSLMHWLNVPRRREGERIRRLPLTLLLLLQLLVAALIGLALGRPQLAGALGGGSRQVAVVVDTSTSMAARQGATTRFALAQERARAALRGLRAGDRATLIAAGPAARVVAAGGASELAGMLAAIDGLQPGGAGADVAGALTLAEASFDNQRRRQVVVITDGALPEQQGAPATELSGQLDWQQVGDEQPNRAVIAFAARPWGGKVQIYARAANYGPMPFQTTVRLYGDDRQVDTRSIAIAAGGETELTWTLPKGYARLRAELDGRDALPQDDAALLSLAQVRPLKALLVSAKPDALRRALAAVPGVSVNVVDPASYTPGAVDLTVFDGFLPPAWPDGAALAINPPPGGPLLEVGPQPRRAGEDALVQSGALLAGLSLDGVSFGAVQPVTAPAWAETQLARGPNALILRGRSGAHEIAVWTFDLASSNLPTRLAFPLLVARTVRDLTPPPLPPSLQAGAPLILRPDPRAAEVRVSGPDGASASFAAAPSVAIDTLTQPGFYQVEERGAGGDVFRGQVPVNAGAAIESDLRPRPAPAIAGVEQGSGGAPQREMKDLWPWLALGALAVLMLEWGYIHR
ncbi:MAG TPA: VWA domain-containing protein [Roseiflexaceae bacterium]